MDESIDQIAYEESWFIQPKSSRLVEFFPSHFKLITLALFINHKRYSFRLAFINYSRRIALSIDELNISIEAMAYSSEFNVNSFAIEIMERENKKLKKRFSFPIYIWRRRTMQLGCAN